MKKFTITLALSILAVLLVATPWKSKTCRINRFGWLRSL